MSYLRDEVLTDDTRTSSGFNPKDLQPSNLFKTTGGLSQLSKPSKLFETTRRGASLKSSSKHVKSASSKKQETKTSNPSETSSQETSSHNDNVSSFPICYNSTDPDGKFNTLKCKMKGCYVFKPTQEDLYDHIKTDHPIRKHRCDVCPMSFDRIFNLSRHKVLHETKKAYQCGLCGKRFSQRGHCVRHQKVRHGEKCYIREYLSATE